MEKIIEYEKKYKIPDDHYFVEINFKNTTSISLNSSNQLIDIFRILYSKNIQANTFEDRVYLAGKVIRKLPSRQGSIREIISGPSKNIQETAKQLVNIVKTTKAGKSLSKEIKNIINKENVDKVDIKMNTDFTDLEAKLRNNELEVDTYKSNGTKVRSTKLGTNINFKG